MVGNERLGNRASRTRHQLHLLRKLIPPRSRDQQPFLRPRHSPVVAALCRASFVEEFHVLGGLGFRGFDLAEADEGERQKTTRHKTQDWIKVRLRKLNFGIVSAAKMQEVVQVEGVDDVGVGFSGRNEVHVVVNAPTAYSSGLSDGECCDDFFGRKRDYGDARQNSFREHPNGEVGSDPDTEFSARQG